MGTIYRNGKVNTIIKNGKIYGYASGSEIPIEIVEKTNTITTISTSGNDASISIDYYEDGTLIDSTGTILYSTVNNKTKAINFHLTKIWYDTTHTNWRIEALCDCYYNDNIYTEGETIRNWSYATFVDFDVNNINRKLVSPILKGTTTPTSAQGNNGQIYLKYDEYDYDTFMNGKIIVQINKNDNTDKKMFFVGLEKDANDISITDNDLLSYLSDVTNGYKKAGYSYSQNQVRNGNIGFYNLGDGVKLRSWSIDWTTLGNGTYYSLLDLNEPATSASESSGQTNIYVPSYYDSTNIISSTYLKVNNTWQNLIGSDIDDVGNATPVIPFDYEIVSQLSRVQTANPNPVSVTFTKDLSVAFAVGLIADNVSEGNITFDTGDSIGPLSKKNESFASAGFIKTPNSTLTGYFPYSDGGAFYNLLDILAMSRIPSDFCIRATSKTTNISVTLDKLYNHTIIFIGANKGTSGMTLELNGNSFTLTEETAMYGRYTYHGIEKIDNINTTTLSFVYSGEPADNDIVVFAYNE